MSLGSTLDGTARLGRTTRLWLPLLAASLVGLGASTSPASPLQDPALARLERAVRAHPDDPDLAWAFARRLARAGRIDETLAVTQRHLERWSQRRPDAVGVMAEALLEGGSPTAARGLLDEALRQRPPTGPLLFTRGLAHRAEGRIALANRDFEAAGRLEPKLLGEALLVRALGHLDLGEEEQAVQLLQDLLRRDPSGEAAIRARLLLRRRERLALEPSWRIEGYGGVEWDENVTLESSENEVPASGSSDLRGIWGLGGSWRAWADDSRTFTLGYRYDQTAHEDLDRFDILANTFFGSLSWRLRDRWALRLDGLGWSVLRDGDSELGGGSLRPSLLYSFGPGRGVLRSFAQVELLEFDEDPAFEQWDRDAVSVGAGLEYLLPLFSDESWTSLSFSYQRTITESDTSGDASGLDGDFDHDSWRLRAAGRLDLPLGIIARIDASYVRDDYANENLSHFLSTLGELRRREDDTLSGGIALSRSLTKHVALEVYWRGTRRYSNVAAFDYDKQVAGALVRFSTD